MPRGGHYRFFLETPGEQVPAVLQTATAAAPAPGALLLHGLSSSKERMADSTKVFNEIMATPDKGIPQDLLEKAHCVVIVPGMKQAALGIGGKFGRGYATCRRMAGGWGAPVRVCCLA